MVSSFLGDFLPGSLLLAMSRKMSRKMSWRMQPRGRHRWAWLLKPCLATSPHTFLLLAHHSVLSAPATPAPSPRSCPWLLRLLLLSFTWLCFSTPASPAAPAPSPCFCVLPEQDATDPPPRSCSLQIRHPAPAHSDLIFEALSSHFCSCSLSLSSLDLVQVASGDPIVAVKGWTSKETLLLLEAVSRFGENWTHVHDRLTSFTLD